MYHGAIQLKTDDGLTLGFLGAKAKRKTRTIAMYPRNRPRKKTKPGTQEEQGFSYSGGLSSF